MKKLLNGILKWSSGVLKWSSGVMEYWNSGETTSLRYSTTPKCYLTYSAILFLIFTCTASADSTYVGPSFYYTRGEYSSEKYSDSYAFYNTLEITKKIFLLNNYTHLNIKTSEWNYPQQMFLAGGLYSSYPFFVKMNYAHIKGDFEYTPVPDIFNYSDYSNLYNIDFSYGFDWNYIGAAYTFINQIGYLNQQSNQITLRLEKVFFPDWLVSVRPSFSSIKDGRKLFSVAGKIHFQAFDFLLLKTGGFAGERAYYFDSDLLTLYNQDETHKYNLFAQVEYKFIPQLTFVLSYQHNKFSSYNINYFIAGVKGNFLLF